MTDDTGRLPLPTHTGQPSASDERRFGFFMIHNSVVDNFGLTPYEGWLYVIIARHVNQKTGVAFPSLTTLSNEGRMSRMQVTRCLKSLQEKGLLEVTPQPITGKRFSTLCGPMGSGTKYYYRLIQVIFAPLDALRPLGGHSTKPFISTICREMTFGKPPFRNPFAAQKSGGVETGYTSLQKRRNSQLAQRCRQSVGGGMVSRSAMTRMVSRVCSTCWRRARLMGTSLALRVGIR